MRVTGKVPVDLKRSEVKIDYECPICGFIRYSHWTKEAGLHFEGDFDEWPDVFKMEQVITTFVFAKPRFAQFLVDTRLKPVMLTRIEDLWPYWY